MRMCKMHEIEKPSRLHTLGLLYSVHIIYHSTVHCYMLTWWSECILRYPILGTAFCTQTNYNRSTACISGIYLDLQRGYTL